MGETERERGREKRAVSQTQRCGFCGVVQDAILSNLNQSQKGSELQSVSVSLSLSLASCSTLAPLKKHTKTILMKIFIRMPSAAAGCFPLQNRTYLSTCMHLKAIVHYNAQRSERRPANKEKEGGITGEKQEQYLRRGTFRPW